MDLNQLAETYVKLVLATGQHNPNYVDAYYGPAEWQAEVKKQPLTELLQQSAQLSDDIAAVSDADDNWRRLFLQKHVVALDFYLRQLAGERSSFNQESQALYDAVSPALTEQDFARTLQELAELLPGSASLNQRLTDYQLSFAIPVDRLDKVFAAAIDEARARTKRYISLPDHESFQVEYLHEARPWDFPDDVRNRAREAITLFHRLLMVAAAFACVGFVRGRPGLRHSVQGLLFAAIGAITALLGGPVFLVLLLREKRGRDVA